MKLLGLHCHRGIGLYLNFKGLKYVLLEPILIGSPSEYNSLVLFE